jgi:hypothetical protein
MIRFKSLPYGARQKVLAAGFVEINRLRKLHGVFVDTAVVDKILEGAYIVMSDTHADMTPPLWRRLLNRIWP